VARRAADWVDDRVGVASFGRKALDKAFPDHWAFMLGEIAMYCFLILVATGIFLSLFFSASSREVVYDGPYAPLQGQRMSAAYDSVLRLSFETRAGLVMRQIHHWAALVFLGAVVLHLLRIFFTGAFRRPREINWLIGSSLLLLGWGAGFTGYSLPDDLLSGTGVRIAYSVVLSIPVIGTWMASLAFGGEFPTEELIGRLHIMHVFLIPAAIATAMTAHLALVWRQKHTQFRAPGRTEDTVEGSRLWPSYATKSVALGLFVAAVLALLGGLFQINPVWVYGPFDPSVVSAPAQPDWYLGWLEGALRLAPPFELRIFGKLVAEPFFPGVLLPGIFLGLVATWPFIERWLTGDREEHHLLDRPRDAPFRSAVGVLGLSFFALLTLAGSNDVMATLLHVPVETITVTFRVLVLAVPPVAAMVTYRMLRQLQASDLHPVAAPQEVLVRRTAAGGFEVLHPEAPPGERDRLRAALAHQPDARDDAEHGPEDRGPGREDQAGGDEQGGDGEGDRPRGRVHQWAVRLLKALFVILGIRAVLRLARRAARDE
jgi:ubiquinol-cytochrome c reductase cytochrome b subunit